MFMFNWVAFIKIMHLKLVVLEQGLGLTTLIRPLFITTLYPYMFYLELWTYLCSSKKSLIRMKLLQCLNYNNTCTYCQFFFYSQRSEGYSLVHYDMVLNFSLYMYCSCDLRLYCCKISFTLQYWYRFLFSGANLQLIRILESSLKRDSVKFNV